MTFHLSLPFAPLVLSLCVMLSACGSLRDRTQHISVDAEPRGVEISDQEGRVLGEAPLFYRVNSTSTLTFTLTHEEHQHKESVSCDFQWVQTPLENAPLPLLLSPAGAPVALGVYGAALLTDVLTGAAYHCPERVMLRASLHRQETSTAPHYCPRFLQVNDASLSPRAQADVIEGWWQRRTPTSDERCEAPHVIKDDEAWAHRLDLPLEELNEGSLERMREVPSLVNRLGYETKASHLLHLTLSEDTPSLTLTELDLHTLKTTRVTMPLSSALQEETQSVTHNLRALFKHTSGLIPDTLGLSFMLRSFDARDATGEPVSVDHASQSFTLTHISHPNAFRPWDYALNVHLGGGADLKQRFTLPTSLEGGARQHEVAFDRYALDATLTLTGHTPLGAVGVSLGPGVGLYRLSDPRLQGKTHFTGEFKSGFHYTFFFTDKLMGRFTVNVIELGGEVNERVLTHLSDVAFMVGYYFPTLQRLPSAALGEGG